MPDAGLDPGMLCTLALPIRMTAFVRRVRAGVMAGVIATMQAASTLAAVPDGAGPLPIYVTPYYDSKGPQVRVGQWSAALAEADRGSIAGIAAAMAREQPTLTVAAMYVLAIRLYDLGERDAAVRWFYAAQYRARLFHALLDPARVGTMGSPAFELNSAHAAFQQLAGPYLNGYAGCDRDKWLAAIAVVRAEHRRPVDLAALYPSVAFVPAGQWAARNDEVNAGLGKLAEHVETRWEEMRAQRAANDADRRFCRPAS